MVSAPRSIGSAQNFNKIPVLGLVPESGSSAPASPALGQLWLDTSITPARLKTWESVSGTPQWVLVSSTGNEVTSAKGTANGYASLDASTKVPIAQLPTGTSNTTVAIGNDTRIVNAEQTTNKGAVNGYAGLDSTQRLAAANLPLAITAAGLTGAAAASRYVGATASGAPTSGTFAVGDFVIDQTGNLWVCTVLGTPGTWVSVLRFGTTATTAAAGNDARLSDQRVPTDNSVTGGTTGAGVKIQAGTITDANINANNKDGAAGTPSLRTLGTGAAQAASGADARFTDARTPTGTAGGDLAGSNYPNPVIAALAVTDGKVATANKDGLANVPSMRTLGTGAQQALGGTTRLDQIAVPTSPVLMNGQVLRNLADPSQAQDAATKAYVDATASGLDVKASVRFASTGNIAVTYNATGGTSGRGQITAAPTTIDGPTSLAVGNRILLKNQTTAAQNGIWVVTTLGTGANGVWERAVDFDSDVDVTSGAFTFVEEGTTNADSGFVLTTDNPITIGGASGTALAFAQFSGAGTILAGNGLSKNGNTLAAVGTTNRIAVGAGGIDIDPNYAGQGTITTVGGLTAGSLGTGFTPVGLAQGGTGATTAAAARTALAAPGYVQALMGALVAGTETLFTHGLNNQFVHAQFFDATTNQEITFSWRQANATQLGVTADIGYAANAVRAVVVG